MGEGNNYSFLVKKDEAGLRLDVFLSSRSDLSLPRAQIKKAADSGKILLNSLPAKAGRLLREGDKIVFERLPPVPCDVAPEEIPLHVVYEDKFLLVVDKPAGMVVHPAAGNYRGTLVNALLFHCLDLSGIGGVMRPGIVHRLDKGTSGLLVVAKCDEAHRGLMAQFKRHEVKKVYHALVYGNVKGDEGAIDAPVGRDAADRKKMSTRTRRGKEARTSWRVCERYGGISLLTVNIETGRTHQIRVHLTYLGYPVVGDSVYGSAKRLQSVADTFLRAKLKGMSRPALHASSLCFTHPVTGESMSFSSPLPEDMAMLCAFLRSSER
ncbi:MAG: RluA family pseudouridine synthase [Syntrophales bacterium LBB04]|nr:RluA family pseudouridine synthase [Syntrophales bacterium LBB04]